MNDELPRVPTSEQTGQELQPGLGEPIASPEQTGSTRSPMRKALTRGAAIIAAAGVVGAGAAAANALQDNSGESVAGSGAKVAQVSTYPAKGVGTGDKEVPAEPATATQAEISNKDVDIMPVGKPVGEVEQGNPRGSEAGLVGQSPEAVFEDESDQSAGEQDDNFHEDAGLVAVQPNKTQSVSSGEAGRSNSDSAVSSKQAPKEARKDDDDDEKDDGKAMSFDSSGTNGDSEEDIVGIPDRGQSAENPPDSEEDPDDSGATIE